MTIGEEIKERRIQLGWSQGYLAAQASRHGDPVAQQTVARIEAGGTRTSRYTTQIMAALRAAEEAKGPTVPEPAQEQPQNGRNERYIKLPEDQLREGLRLVAKAAGAADQLADDLAQAGVELLIEPPIEALGADPVQSLRVQFELLTRRSSHRGLR